MRVSDRDRQAAADRLRVAHDEGRLGFAEYDERLASAYQAVHFADLEPLFADLPVTHGLAVAAEPARPAARPPVLLPRDMPAAAAGLPTALKVLWIVWASVMAINLTVWLLVSLSVGVGTVYFWPMWLVVPGSALLVTSGAIMAARQNSPPRGSQE
jgi:hypothetical protein